MRTRELGNSSLTVSALGFDCMGRSFSCNKTDLIEGTRYPAAAAAMTQR